MMIIARIILALILAVSIAAVPAVATAAAPSPVAMTAGPTVDAPCDGCCHHRDELGAAACLLKCGVFAGTLVSAPAVVTPGRIDRAEFSELVKTMHGYQGRPPTHPPPL